METETELHHIDDTSTEKYSTSFFGATFNLVNTTVGSGI
jgi:amino acid permease